MPSPAFWYCIWWKPGWGLGMRLWWMSISYCVFSILASQGSKGWQKLSPKHVMTVHTWQVIDFSCCISDYTSRDCGTLPAEYENLFEKGQTLADSSFFLHSMLVFVYKTTSCIKLHPLPLLFLIKQFYLFRHLHWRRHLHRCWNIC